MSRINLLRVLSGGLVAGAILAGGEMVLNNVVLADELALLMPDQKDTDFPIWRFLAMIGVLILYGVVLIWIYVAIRPRFGPGAVTAVVAGLTLWAIAWGMMGASLSLAGMITPRIAWISALWGVIEVPVAALAGA